MENNFMFMKKIARIGGLLYLIIIVTGILGELLIRNKMIVSGDAGTTANNIMASGSLWRIGVANDILMHVCDVGLMLIFYILLKPVNKYLAMLTVLFTLVQTAVLVATKLNLIAALFPLDNAEYLKAFDARQLQTLTYLAIRADGYGFAIGLIFFGFACLVLGYLIFRSEYFPKLLGVMMQIAGVCYLTNSFALILAPSFGDKLFPWIHIPSFIAELSLCLWLLIKGVRDQTPS